MSDNETYEGWKNRETWAFWLHVSNDQGWYEAVVDQAREILADHWAWSDSALGAELVAYVKSTLDELEQAANADLYSPERDAVHILEAYRSVRMMRDEIGSWWRIDHAEIGAEARQLASDS